MLFAFALIWLATALGLAAKSVETASNTPMFLTLLPFLGSGFVPTSTMPTGLRQFAEYQPFTPVTQAVRALLTGGAVGTSAIIAIAWGTGVTVARFPLGQAAVQRASATGEVAGQAAGPHLAAAENCRPGRQACALG